ncbi:superoxide dismutase family protein [Sphingobium sp. HBC34]|uniref:Superoxide dismutase family protein n=1 Tax=Sphingobium cyanobacteriorum TaxID=3063954 RepID=A0ABT8ZKG2_9SPHN|nr:superoxide dismutase family protein [Sphingobium sp. HBC34]MDO7834946.1 superoxide dismutase family protein [Sphingobium sp. HBC34]
MKILTLVAALPIVLMASACATTSADTAPAPTASAKLAAGDGAARGMATVTQASDGLHVLVKAQGLTPGIHAVHIHTTGQCAGPDFASAGGHWNPTGHKHGTANPAGPHMGDMPNMTVGPDGSGAIEYHVPGSMIREGATPLLDTDGAAIVVHAQADDNMTDPAGNAGGRIACGVLAAG